MIIRQFEQADARGCCSVINACITSMPDIDAPTRFYLLSNNVASDFYNLVKDDYALVAELHDQIVAIGSLKDDTIHNVHVSPDYQGNGIGETLILSLEAEATANNIEIVRVEADLGSIAFYEQLGYSVKSKKHSKIGYTTIPLANMSKKIADTAGV